MKPYRQGVGYALMQTNTDRKIDDTYEALRPEIAAAVSKQSQGFHVSTLGCRVSRGAAILPGCSERVKKYE